MTAEEARDYLLWAIKHAENDTYGGGEIVDPVAKLEAALAAIAADRKPPATGYSFNVGNDAIKFRAKD